jgi:hypothetical protein
MEKGITVKVPGAPEIPEGSKQDPGTGRKQGEVSHAKEVSFAVCFFDSLF